MGFRGYMYYNGKDVPVWDRMDEIPDAAVTGGGMFGLNAAYNRMPQGATAGSLVPAGQTGSFELILAEIVIFLILVAIAISYILEAIDVHILQPLKPQCFAKQIDAVTYQACDGTIFEKGADGQWHPKGGAAKDPFPGLGYAYAAAGLIILGAGVYLTVRYVAPAISRTARRREARREVGLGGIRRPRYERYDKGVSIP